MRFTAPVYLVLLLVPGWFLLTRARSRARSAVRCLVSVLIVFAVAGMQVAIGQAPLTVFFLIDQSHSMSASQSDLQRRLGALAAHLGRDDRAGLIVFGAQPVVERGLGPPLNVTGPISATVGGTSTDLEAALRLARNTMPSEGPRRIVLLSDGNETRGDAAQEASHTAAAGIVIDAAPPEHLSKPSLFVSRLSAPIRAAIAEPFALTASVEGSPGQRAEVIVTTDNGASMRREVRVGPDGTASETLTMREREPGIRVYRARARLLDDDLGPEDGIDSAGAMVTISGRPRVLIVGSTPGRLDAVFGSSYDVRDTAPGLLPRSAAGLHAYDAIVLDDVSQESLEPTQLSALTEHVETLGAGLFVLGSPRSLDASVLPDEGLGKLLPVDLRPRAGVRAPQLALVVVVDKSGSMDERVGGVAKIDLARQSIRRVLEAVPATDAVGVIAFDRAPSIVAPLKAGHDPRAISEQLRTVAAAGATEISPAIELAREWLATYPSARRHILLVSDGRSSPADSQRLQTLVRDTRFTLSVVSLGGDRDRQFMSGLASSAGGRSYFPDDERQLPAIVAREAARVAGGRVVEEPFTPRTSAHPILTAIDPRLMPHLTGYVVGAARPAAEVPLTSHRDDPVLAVWQFGAGRVGVYTADLSSTWSAELRQSRIFGPLMNQTLRWIARRQHDDGLYTRLRAERDGIQITVEAQSGDTSYVTGLSAHATVRLPSGDTKEVELVESAPGRYEAAIPAPDTGEYMVSIAARSRDGSFDAHSLHGLFWSGDQEYRSTAVNTELLSQLARTTGGMVLGDDANAFSKRPRGYRDAGSSLLAAAFLLFLGDVVAPGVMAIVRRASRRPDNSTHRAAA